MGVSHDIWVEVWKRYAVLALMKAKVYCVLQSPNRPVWAVSWAAVEGGDIQQPTGPSQAQG